ncbi:MAG: D-alanyl-D-alanine carboxypeptidase [Proteobacteria bacterium]|nr:D-alanyl-D-alanine carboxypeptidase [Pseudomonadota bacterium]MBU1686473.1 D-alanyl-D-alanine carboxypeptidase [Pseudomonadota bacterium]
MNEAENIVQRMRFVNKSPAMRLIQVVLLAGIFFLSGIGQAAAAKRELPAAMKELVTNGGFGVSRNGTLLFSHNPDQLFTPASILKVLISLAAFDRLGPTYRFTTDFLMNGQNDLFIRGHGDPLLVSEEVALIMEHLKSQGIPAINRIILDGSTFALEDPSPKGASDSLNPYDVLNGGLAVNFNTINIQVMEDGSVRSAEPQTPLLPMMLSVGGKLPRGVHRVNISTVPARISELTGQLFRWAQQESAIPGNGVIQNGVTPDQATLIYRHQSSRTLTDLVRDLLRYSNNYVANQLFLTLGMKEFGPPATWAKARAAMADCIRDLDLDDEISVIEGSGLAGENRLSVRGMLALLERFRPYAELLPERDGLLVKSGTLSGVYSYAGYLPDGDSFAIILNQPDNNRDRLLLLLRKYQTETFPRDP